MPSVLLGLEVFKKNSYPSLLTAQALNASKDKFFQ